MNIHIINYRDVLEEGFGLVLTANATEKAAVERALGAKAKADLGRSSKGASLSFVDPHILVHVTGRAGGSDEMSVGRLARSFLLQHMPSAAFIILVGVCWGNLRRVAVGDVIVATQVASLNHQRLSQSGTEYRQQLLKSPIRLPEGLIESVAAKREDSSFALHHGTLGSAEIHFAAGGARDALLDQFPELLGGEMEAYDFLPDFPETPWVVIKAVSDDAGDEVDRLEQRPAAEHAASILPGLIRALTECGELHAPTEECVRRTLVEGIIGDALAVTAPANFARINDYLNDEIGPVLARRLGRYTSEATGEGNLQRALTMLLLEVIQNAMRHGGAGRASLDFYETKIVLRDDGDEFQLHQLTGERGGSLAWQNFREQFADRELASLAYKRGPRNQGNQYTITIHALSAELREARTRCSATVGHGMVGTARERAGVLSFDPTCEILHVRTAPVRMMSRSLSMTSSIIALLEAGKSIYLECPNRDEVEMYERLLRPFLGPKLRIYVGDRSGA